MSFSMDIDICIVSIQLLSARRDFRYIGLGYVCHCNDQGCYNLMPSLRGEMQFPAGVYMRADLQCRIYVLQT